MDTIKKANYFTFEPISVFSSLQVIDNILSCIHSKSTLICSHKVDILFLYFLPFAWAVKYKSMYQYNILTGSRKISQTLCHQAMARGQMLQHDHKYNVNMPYKTNICFHIRLYFTICWLWQFPHAQRQSSRSTPKCPSVISEKYKKYSQKL